MRTRNRWQTAQRSDSGQSLFGGTGWLFADLMLAIGMAFLVAATLGFPPPAHTPPHQNQKHPGTPPVTKPPLPALDFSYVTINLNVDPAGLAGNKPTAIASVRNQILGSGELKSRCAGQPEAGCVGLVLLFGGDPDSTTEAYSYAQSLDAAMWNVLEGLGQEKLYFQRAINRNFVNIGAPATAFELNIYVFKTS